MCPCISQEEHRSSLQDIRAQVAAPAFVSALGFLIQLRLEG